MANLETVYVGSIAQTLPMTHNERRKWMKANFPLFAHLKYYYVKKEGKPRMMKISLDKYREKWKEKENIF